MWRFGPMAVCAILLALPGPVPAETGMCLVVDKTNTVLHRIDYRNDAIIHTTPAIGSNVKHTRFSPDGDWLVYLDEDGEVCLYLGLRGIRGRWSDEDGA